MRIISALKFLRFISNYIEDLLLQPVKAATKLCGRDEVFHDQGMIKYWCERTCADPTPIIAGNVIHFAVSKIYRCGNNERFEPHSLHESCYPSCANPHIEQCPGGEVKNQCRCKPGFFRDSKGMCTKDCSHEPCIDKNAVRRFCGASKICQPSCDDNDPVVANFYYPCGDPNAVPTTCAPSKRCQPSCKKRAPDPSCKKKTCIPNGCVCKPGFIIHEGLFGVKRCIRVSECSKAG
ncbi:hypothetical protein Y032_0194g1449 [Ancylostoma ceylanicum]|uniref:TIL domain-containing protein n=1 Tax=Ancylostoma ceylanicum TaxID=53326 RepID=A0A016SPZ6_9BILA|nr:hypothetical protein Y032_0194g1449 [Ancylostoma ceylanicum]